MGHSAAMFIVAMLVASTLTPIVRGFALRRGLLDAVTERKVHGTPIPRLGGVAIVGGFYLALVGPFVSLWRGSLIGDPRWLAALLVGGIAVALLGVCDDLRGVRPRTKLIVQLAVAVMVWVLGVRIDALALPFGATLPLGALGLPFTLLWIVGVTNAVNLIDGLDGLAGGLALIAIGATFAISHQGADHATMLLGAALAGATLGFLFYNFNPATIFMGDTGSLFLGFFLAVSTIRAGQRSSPAVDITIPVLVLGLPLADTLLAIVRRALNARPLFQADKAHIHHRLIARGHTQRRAVATLYGVGTLLGLAAIVLMKAGPLAATVAIGCVAIAAGLLLGGLGYLRRPAPLLRVRGDPRGA